MLKEDAEFVAGSRSDIPYLLAHIDALQAERDALAARARAAEAEAQALREAAHVRCNDDEWQCVYCLRFGPDRDAIDHESDCPLAATAAEQRDDERALVTRGAGEAT
jgi:outer membrane murein-binding lipoprotein Lpp